MAGGSKGICTRKPADTWICRWEILVSNEAEIMGKIGGTCTDYKKVQGQVGLALDGDRTRSGLGGRGGGHLRV